MPSGPQRDLHFGFPYGELVNSSFEKEAYFTRDESTLAIRGVTTVRITAFAALRSVFQAVDTDGTMVGLITVAKEDRDAKMGPLVIAVREIISIARGVFGEKSGKFKTFNSTDLSALDAGGLCTLSVTVADQGTEYLTEMEAQGLTAAMVTEIGTLRTALEPTIRAFTKAEGNQQLMTVARHNAANALFDEMSSMCGVGHVYYADRDAVKAADYVIYDLPNNIQQRNGDVAISATVGRALLGLSGSSVFEVKVNKGNSLSFYFSKTAGGIAGATTITVGNNPNNFETHSAESLGYNNATGYIFFCIHNPSSDEAGSYSARVAA